MTDLRVQHTEKLTGAGHPSEPDILNRLLLAEHGIGGEHSKVKTITQDMAGLLRITTPAGGGRVREFADVSNAATVGAIEIGETFNVGLAFKSVTSITRVGTTATVTATAHGYANGNSILIQGADQPEYNGIFTISNVTTNTFDYTVSGAPTTPATGTILATNGSWAGRDVPGPCWLTKWLDDGGTLEFWYAVSAAGGSAPTWQLFSKFDLTNGRMLSPSGGIYASQRTQVSVTGTTNEVSVFSTTIKGGALGKLGMILTTVVGTFSGAGGNKTFRLKYGGVTVATGTQTGTGTLTGTAAIRNRNATGAQYCASFAGALFGGFSAITVDSTADKTLEVTIQLANAGDTATVETIDAEVFYKEW